MVGKTCEKGRFWAVSEKEKKCRMVEMMVMYVNEWTEWMNEPHNFERKQVVTSATAEVTRLVRFVYLCTSVILSVCLSVCVHDYRRSNRPISLKLGVIIGPTNRKNLLTFGRINPEIRIRILSRIRSPDHFSTFLIIAE